jgi:hypothetical protein
MKTQRKLVFAIALWAVTALTAAYCLTALNASNTLLRKLGNLRPGVNVNSVKDELGIELHTYTDTDSILVIGRIKDETFCQGKRLHVFFVSGLPDRAIDVYTDKDDVIAYVTWHGL